MNIGETQKVHEGVPKPEPRKIEEPIPMDVPVEAPVQVPVTIPIAPEPERKERGNLLIFS